ncbi:hypothetical protein CcCBS67573_g09560 [Chytriomyces confervae]|uniref:Uncharacterized protein n=1 Tax=Chytriomyces confervae TaxID=246404 RepID=A0A507DUN6_9FUNG|nr:hypothetical protein CcCBS67573_g09560 [Chytriomyces confervae]
MKPLFATTRQELCEYAPFFRSYQSGVQITDGVCVGFLIDKFASFGDFFNGPVFVSHGGGRSRPRAAMLGQGGFALSNDFELEDSQEESDRSIAGLIKAKETCSPVVVIMGSQYPLIQDANLPGRYNILGSFLVRDYWASKEYGDTRACDSAPSLQGPTARTYHIRYKFKFQWIQSSLQQLWFSNQPHVEPIQPPLKFLCRNCNRASSSVYRERTCLNPSCTDFFVVIDEVTGARSDLDITQAWNVLYNAEFVKPWLSDGDEKWPPDTIIPSLLKDAETRTSQIRNDIPSALDCKECGRISCRVEWNYWKCRNPVCITEPIVYDLKSAIPAHQNPSEKRANGLGYMHSSVLSKPMHGVLRPESVFSANPTTAYTLPNGGGTILHIRNSFHGSSIADEILNSFVEADNLPLSRQTFRQHQCKCLSSWIQIFRQFSYNVGAAYRYASSHGASDINDAPAPVQMALEHLKSLIPGYCFNEYLVLGYLNDDEPGLGASVVSWSFGSEAEMCFRERASSKRRRNNAPTSTEKTDPTSLLNYIPDAGHHLIPSVNESLQTWFQTIPRPFKLYPPLSHIGHIPVTIQNNYLSTINSNITFPLSYDSDHQKMLRAFKRDTPIPNKRDVSGTSSPNPSPKRTSISMNKMLNRDRLSSINEEYAENDPTVKKVLNPTPAAAHQMEPAIVENMVPQTDALDTSTTKPSSSDSTKINDSGKKEVQRVCLKLILRHGDLLIMVSETCVCVGPFLVQNSELNSDAFDP